MREVHAFKRRIGMSPAYMDDCREYMRLYNQKNRRYGLAMSTWPNVFLKLMRAMLKQISDINLDTLTREEVLARELPYRTIAASISAGYLEQVHGYENLNNLI